MVAGCCVIGLGGERAAAIGLQGEIADLSM